MDRMVLADGQARQEKNRMKARAIIIVMRSPNHKREALIRIKRFLAQQQIREVSISDCFPNQSMDKARALARMGAEQRRERQPWKSRWWRTYWRMSRLGWRGSVEDREVELSERV